MAARSLGLRLTSPSIARRPVGASLFAAQPPVPARFWPPAKRETDGAQFWKPGSKAAFPSSSIAAIWDV